MTYTNQPLQKVTYDTFPINGKGKLIVTKELQSKIHYLHKEVGRIEWCGIFTYIKEEGHISKPETVVIKAVDVYAMDIGSHSYTEFDSDDPKDMCNMMDRMPSFLDHKYGLIHTHHEMTTFFSGTDIQELHDNVGNYNPYYISLIVNFAGTYSARVAFLKNIPERQIEILDDDNEKGFITTKERTVMFTFDLNVEIEGQENIYPELELRLQEIKDSKKTKIVSNQEWKSFTRPANTAIQTSLKLEDSNIKKEDIKTFLPMLVLQNENFRGNIWEAFIKLNKECEEDPAVSTFIYEVWENEIYGQVFEEFDCQDFDSAQYVFKEMIKMLQNIKGNALYGNHVVKLIDILSVYVSSIEVG
jgi:hypothetical protein